MASFKKNEVRKMSQEICRNRRIRFEIIVFAVVLQFCFLSSAYALPDVGTVAPGFTVTSGNGRELSLKDLSDTVITIFYEPRTMVESNRVLKDELSRFYYAQSDKIKSIISRVSIIDCRHAFWPFTLLWKKELTKASIKEKIIIYGDWNGNFAKSYGIISSKSNFIIIDKNRIVRYAKAGIIHKGEISRIKNLLTRLSK